MAEIIPAIMPQSYEDLTERVRSVAHYAPVVQVDIMDGVFVSNTTWPFKHGDLHRDDYFMRIQREEVGLPFWEDIDYELDLMVQNPNLAEWVALGPRRIVLHIESLKNPETTLAEAAEFRNNIEIGISFDDEFDIEKLEPFIPLVDFIQVMGIRERGHQGESFEPRSLGIIASLRKKHPKLIISVDGGVHEETVHRLKDAGVNRFVVGSAVFGEGDPGENIQILRDLLQ